MYNNRHHILFKHLENDLFDKNRYSTCVFFSSVFGLLQDGALKVKCLISNETISRTAATLHLWFTDFY